MKTIVRESKQKMYATHRNGRDDLIKQQGKQLKEDEQVMSDLQEKATKSEKQLKGKVDCLRHRAAEVHAYNCTDESDINEQEQVQKETELLQEIRFLEQDNTDLKDQVRRLSPLKVVSILMTWEHAATNFFHYTLVWTM